MRESKKSQETKLLARTKKDGVAIEMGRKFEGVEHFWTVMVEKTVK